MATPRMNAQWRRIRDGIKQMWSDHAFDDKHMKKTRGSLRMMINLIHDKTGEPRAEIRRKIVSLI